MKARVDQAALATAAADVARILPTRPSQPVMAGVRLDATADGITLAAFDYERSLVVSIPAEVAKPGTVLLPGRALAGLVTGLAGDIDLHDDGHRATLAAGRSKVTLPLGALENYPALPEPGETTVRLAVADLATALAAVAWSVIADGDGLKGLMHVELTAGHTDITLASTNRNVLSVRHVPAHSEGEFTALVGPRELADALRGQQGDVALGLVGGVLTVRGSDRVATIRTCAEDFVPWSRIIPQEARQAVVDRDQLLDAAIIAQRADESPFTPIVLTVVDDGFDYEGGSRDQSDGNQVSGHIDAEIAAGPSLRLGVKPELLIGALKAMQPGPIRLGLGVNATRAFLVEQDDTDGLHVVQPIRLKD